MRPTYNVLIKPNPAAANRAVLSSTNDGTATGSGVPVEFQGRSQMRVRGESSAGMPQRQYGWETIDNEGNDKAVSMLGLASESDWVLYAPSTDKTLMRNFIAYNTMLDTRGQGSAMQTRFVEVFFNQNGNNTIGADDYRGVYVLMEKIKRDKNRVDIEELTKCDVTAPDISGGYIFKKDKVSIDPDFTTNGGQGLQIVEPEVAVGDARGEGRGSVRVEPCGDRFEPGDLRPAVAGHRRVRVELAEPARDLAFEVSVELAEVGEPQCDMVLAAEDHGCVDRAHPEPVPHRSAVRIGGGQLRSRVEPVDRLHQVEDRAAEHGLVLARGEQRGVRHLGGRERGEHADLASHRVVARRAQVPRAPTQDVRVRTTGEPDHDVLRATAECGDTLDRPPAETDAVHPRPHRLGVDQLRRGVGPAHVSM